MIFRRIFSPTSIRFASSEPTNQFIKTLNNQARYEHAFRVFNRLIQENKVNIKSLLNIIDTCARSKQINRAQQIEIYINQSKTWHNHIRLQTSLIHMYMKLKLIDQGKQNDRIY